MVLLATEDTCGALIVGASDEMLLTGLRVGLAVIRRLRLRAELSGSQGVPLGELGDQRRGQHDHHEDVMFKDGHLAQVPGDQVRMYPHPTIPDASMPVFPGMSVYKKDFPMMACFQTH